MLKRLVKLIVLLSVVTSQAYAEKESFLCIDKKGHKAAKIQLDKFVEHYETFTCYIYDHLACCDEPPYGECLERDGERTEAKISFFNTIMPIPSNLEVDFTVYRNYDQNYKVRLYGGAALPGNEKYSFYLRRGHNESTNSTSFRLSLEKRGHYSSENIYKSYQCHEVKNIDSVFKILRRDEWLQLKNSGEFKGSPHDIRDGFIHLATAGQVEYILGKYFKDEARVYVVKFNSNTFSEEDLRWEMSSSSKKVYPHLYSSVLTFDKVVKHEVIKND